MGENSFTLSNLKNRRQGTKSRKNNYYLPAGADRGREISGKRFY